MKITTVMEKVFSEYEIKEVHWIGGPQYSTKGTNVEISGFDNVWHPTLKISDDEIILTLYSAPCSHLKFTDVDVNSPFDLESVKLVIIEYLQKVREIDYIQKNKTKILQYSRDLKLKKLE